MRDETTDTMRGRLRARIDARLEELLPHPATPPAVLHEAMRHSVLNGGKRLRPLLCLGAWLASSPPDMAESLCAGPASIDLPGFLRALDAGCAVEFLHDYSLVHDDLPCMDNDELRRGRLSCHKAFGESTAMLVGDALQALAFETLARAFAGDPEAGSVVAELARAAGSVGICGGQMLDIEGEGQPPDARRVEAIDRWKTATLIAAACRLGGMAAGADGERLAALGEFGRQAGMMYQAVDDLLDTTGTAESLGKTPDKDRRAGKQTYVAVLGGDGARRKAKEMAEAAREVLVPFGDSAFFLRELLARMYTCGA